MNEDNATDVGNLSDVAGAGTDLGTGAGQSTGGEGNPQAQTGQATEQGNPELARYRAEVRRLNKALAEKNRSSSYGRQTAGGEGENPFETPQGQYGIALQLATGKLSSKLESVYDLYPEVDAKDIARIRKNPWAYASQEAYINGDFETAATDIEEYLLELAESSKPAAPKLPVQPASVNNNPPSEGNPDDEEPVSDWDLPMEELDKKVAKIKKQAQAKK